MGLWWRTVCVSQSLTLYHGDNMLTKSEITRLKREYEDTLHNLRFDHDREWQETEYDTANDIVEEYLCKIMPSATPDVRKTHRERAVRLIMGESE